MYDFDLTIIGAGPAGGAAAAEAARLGARVALVERHRMGGTCLNYGCDPTKAMLYVAERLHQARTSARYGLKIRSARANWAAVRRYVSDVVDTMRGGSDEDARKSVAEQGIAVFDGTAVFRDAHTLLIDERPLRSERFIIATGTRSLPPPIPGLAEQGYITNREAVNLEHLPKRLAIIGGGPVGVEFAQIFSRFGVRVTLVEQETRILGRQDADLTQQLAALLQDEGITIKVGTAVEAVEAVPSGKRLRLRRAGAKRAHTLVVDEIMVATGFRPDVGALRLDAAGVEVDEHGSIVVDHTLRTTVEHIWSAGDVSSRYQFTNVASEQGKIAARNALCNAGEPFDGRAVPSCVYTAPALAMVGATEDELRQQGCTFRVATLPFDKVERAIAEGRTAGSARLLVGSDDQILGAHILAHRADDLVAAFALAMHARVPAGQVANTLMPYPTRSAAVRLLARRAEGLAD